MLAYWHIPAVKSYLDQKIKKPDKYSSEQNDIPVYKYNNAKLNEFSNIQAALIDFLNRKSTCLPYTEEAILWVGEYLSNGKPISILGG